MTQAPPTTETHRDDILASSVERGLEVTLTHRLPRSWQFFKTRFVTGSPEERLIIVDAPTVRSENSTGIPPVGEILGVTFRMGHKKCMFSTTRQPDAQNAAPGQVTLRWPGHLQRLQRRAYQRVSPPQSSIVTVQFWNVSTEGERDRTSRNIRYGELKDLSAGGVRIDAAEASGFNTGDTCECLFVPKPGAPPIILEAILRHQDDAGAGRLLLGFQFIGLETTTEGRELLTRLSRIVNDYSRHQRKTSR